jgi:hypothetical protein
MENQSPHVVQLHRKAKARKLLERGRSGYDSGADVDEVSECRS